MSRPRGRAARSARVPPGGSERAQRVEVARGQGRSTRSSARISLRHGRPRAVARDVDAARGEHLDARARRPARRWCRGRPSRRAGSRSSARRSARDVEPPAQQRCAPGPRPSGCGRCCRCTRSAMRRPAGAAQLAQVEQALAQELEVPAVRRAARRRTRPGAQGRRRAPGRAPRRRPRRTRGGAGERRAAAAVRAGRHHREVERSRGSAPCAACAGQPHAGPAVARGALEPGGTPGEHQRQRSRPVALRQPPRQRRRAAGSARGPRARRRAR